MTARIVAAGVNSMGRDEDGFNLTSTIQEGLKSTVGRSVTVQAGRSDLMFLLTCLAQYFPDHIVALGDAVREADASAQRAGAEWQWSRRDNGGNFARDRLFRTALESAGEKKEPAQPVELYDTDVSFDNMR
jgi:hypothetical protein